MRHFEFLARILIIPFVSMTLVSCSSSSSSNKGDSAETNINGTYLSECFSFSLAASAQITIVASNGVMTITTTDYLDPDCTTNPFEIIETATYVLGDLTAVDGTVEDLNTATEIDVTNTTVGDPWAGNITYDVVARVGNILFFGIANGDNDGSTPSRRFNRLFGEFPLTRQ